MHVRPEEFRTTRELAREVASCLDALRQADVEKLVITQNGKPVAIMIDVATFENLLRRAAEPKFEAPLEDINKHYPPGV